MGANVPSDGAQNRAASGPGPFSRTKGRSRRGGGVPSALRKGSVGVGERKRWAGGGEGPPGGGMGGKLIRTNIDAEKTPLVGANVRVR